MLRLKKPKKKVKIKEKIWWTAIVLFVYLVCCQIPVYGIAQTSGSDPFYWMRVIIASNRGTLMELGISPIVTSSLVMQLLQGSKLIDMNQGDKEEKNLFQGAQKLLGILITIGEAVAYVVSGMYGEIDELGAGNAILIIVQLITAGILVLILSCLVCRLPLDLRQHIVEMFFVHYLVTGPKFRLTLGLGGSFLEIHSPLHCGVADAM